MTIQHFATINKAFFAEDTTTPALLIGDYNAANGSDAINYVKNKWQDVKQMRPDRYMAPIMPLTML